MQESSDQGKPRKPTDRRDRLANERTFLAWVRTSISIMAFGFVVEKFALFLKRLPYLFGRSQEPPPAPDIYRLVLRLRHRPGGHGRPYGHPGLFPL